MEDESELIAPCFTRQEVLELGESRCRRVQTHPPVCSSTTLQQMGLLGNLNNDPGTSCFGHRLGLQQWFEAAPPPQACCFVEFVVRVTLVITLFAFGLYTVGAVLCSSTS